MINNQRNCETCKYFDVTTMRYCTCNAIGQQIDGEDIALIAKIGCLSHSDARAWIMRDVIEKLELAIKENEKYGVDDYSTYNEGIEKAIAFIRDGVK